MPENTSSPEFRPLDIAVEIKQIHPIMWSGRSYIKARVIDRTNPDEAKFIEVQHDAPGSYDKGAYPSAGDIECIVSEAARALRHQLINHVDP